ncbi:glycoside hydrolase, partial [Phaeosphaeriaceae sp. PMI808]
MFQVLASLILSLSPLVSSHGGALNYTVGETWYPGYDPDGNQTTQESAPWMIQRSWTSNNPILSPSSPYLPCNTPGTPAPSSIPIPAGQNLTAAYGPWLHTVGPMILWLSRCPASCTTHDAASARWFKIAQRGLLSGTIETGTWFQGAFSRWDGAPSLWTERIPAALRAGEYLARHEIVSLHSAGKPQFYAECAHLEVSGEGKGFPGEEYMVGIPGVWSMEREFL